ncbi:MAG: S8/S53 family peptidase [Candidatus Heimdallarchaeota archaeon]|nr:S8/S53 family peptidase [Candidatus Heimdallarchaeota archaeon]
MIRRNQIITAIVIIALVTSVLIYVINQEDPDAVKVGVIDSGCGESQKNKVMRALSFVNQSYGFEYRQSDPYDANDHGTHICQIILDHVDGIELYSAKVAAYDGSLTFLAVFAAVEWLVEDMQVDVINLSLGSSGFLNEELIAIFEQYRDEVIFVAASGNTGSSGDTQDGKGDWPAILPWVTGVGSYLGSQESPAYFSAQGRSYSGTFTSDFSALGVYTAGEKSYSGTSFSTPMITAQYATLIQQFREKGLTYTLNELNAIMASNAGNSEEFNRDTGWGLPQSLSIPDDPIIAIAQPNEYDRFLRFSDETWHLKIKINHYGVNPEDTLSVTGNATTLLSSSSYIKENYATLLTLSFSGAGSNPGVYTLGLTNPYGNDVEYTFNLTSSSLGSILYDHRSSINAYGHSYGEFSKVEIYMRNMGYQVHHQFIQEELDLSPFDLVIAPRFGQHRLLEYGALNRSYTTDLLHSYLEYTNNGGIFLPMLAPVIDTRLDVQDFLDSFSIQLPGKPIHNDYYPISINNFSSSILNHDLVNYDFMGQEITSDLHPSLGWVAFEISLLISVGYEYRSIGVHGNVSLGQIIVLGSSYPISNSYFDVSNLKHFDGFIRNLLNIL